MSARDDAIEEAGFRLANTANLPEWMQVPALGRSLMPVAETAVDAAIPVLLAPIRQAIEDLHPHEPDEHAEGCCDICDYAFALGSVLDEIEGKSP